MFKKVENLQFFKIKSALNYRFSEIALNMYREIWENISKSPSCDAHY